MIKALNKKINFTNVLLIIFIFLKTGVINSNGLFKRIFSFFLRNNSMSGNILEYVILSAFLFFSFLSIFKKKKLVLTKQIILYGLFCLFSCLSCLWALSSKFSLDSLKSVIALLLFLITITNFVDSKESFLKVIKYVVIANVLVSIKILILYWFYSGSAAFRIQSITGIYFNTVGQVLGFAIIFSVYLYKYYNNKKYLLFILPMFLAVLLTESRKSLLIPILGIILILFIEGNLTKIIKYSFLLLFCGFLISFTISKFSPQTFDNINQKLVELVKFANGEETDDWSINLRTFFLNTGKKIFKSHPLKGIGLNNFAFYVGNYTSYGVERYSHNNYIELLCCLGIIGFFIYYSLYIYILFKLLKKRKNIFCIISIAALLVLMIMEWGIVSYSGCLYHLYMFIMYQTIYYSEDLKIRDGSCD